jgi:carboxymethylenebutenolidase
MSAPLLGIFGNDDPSPDTEQVDKIEAELQRLGKTYEFHRYDGAGHGFFAVDRPGYRQAQAVDAWQKVWAWFERYLQPA